MSRDLTGLMTYENSGVAGDSATADVDENIDVASISAAAVVDARRVANSTIEVPWCEAVEYQKSAQVPAAPLCCACIVGRVQRSSNSHCNTDGRVAGRFLPQHHLERVTRSQLF